MDMKKIFRLSFIFIVGLLLSNIYAEDIAWETTPRGVRKGMVVEVNKMPEIKVGVNLEGTATETTLSQISHKLDNRTVYDTQLEQFKFDEDDLKVKFSNTSIDVTGTFWQAIQPVSSTDLDIRDLSSTTDSVKVEGGNTSPVKVEISNLPETQPVSGSITANPTAYSYSPHFTDTTLTDTSVWYAYTIPDNTIELSIKARTGYDYRVSTESNGAHYETIWAGDRFYIQQVRDTTITGTLYFNSPVKAGLVLEIRSMTK